MRGRAPIAALLVVIVSGACVTGSPTAALPTPSPSRSGSPSASPSASSGEASATVSSLRPVLIDTDMAVDDIIAIAVLLRDPTVDVRAITVEGTGEAHCAAGTANAVRLLAAFRQPDVPVACGREQPGAGGREFPEAWRQAADNMYGLQLPAAEPVTADAKSLIADTASAAGGHLTIVAIGPWSNLADAFQFAPELARTVPLIHAMGGAFKVDGNIDLGDTHPADGVEWNLGADPAAVASVMATAVPIMFVPLDATNHVPGTPDLAQSLEADHSAAGADIVNQLFHSQPFMTSSDWFIWDPLAALSLTDPELLTAVVGANATVTTTGSQAGRLAVAANGGRLVNYAADVDAPQVYQQLLAALHRGDPLP